MSRKMPFPWTDRIPRTVEGFSREVEGLVDRFFGGDSGMLSSFVCGQPPINLAETDTHYEVTCDLPGLAVDEISMEFVEGKLVIGGERVGNVDDSEKVFHRLERPCGRFRREVEFPTAVDEEAIDATFRQGVLIVTLPKVEHASGRKIPIRS